MDRSPLTPPAPSGTAQVALACACLGALLVSLVVERMAPGAWAAPFLLAVAAYLTGGAFSAWTAAHALSRGILDIDSLMVIAALGAAGIGRWHEGAVLLFLFSMSNGLEALAVRRARAAIGALVALAPREATVLRGAREERVPIESIRPGDRVLVTAGGRIPVDGVVRKGETEADVSMLTGESRWVPLKPGGAAYAGTLNQTGLIELEATKAAHETYLARIVALVEEAQTGKVRAGRLIDRFGRAYTLAALSATGLLFLLMAGPLGEAPRDAFYRSMVLLVVASPCALVLATPAAMLAAIGHGAREGILFKGGAYVERLGEVAAMAFDKTGILTTGRPRLLSAAAEPGASEAEVLGPAAALERHANHPLAVAVLAAAEARGLALEPVTGLTVHHGRGVSGTLPGGREAWLGNEAMATTEGASVPAAVRARLDAAAAGGETAVLVGAGTRIAGLMTFSDDPRPGAAAAVAGLRALGVRPLVMLTGDHAGVADRLAAALGLDASRAGLLPAEKLDALATLKRAHGPTGMIGDGVNDGPALAAAHVGITLGMASEVALEVADVVLITGDLTRLPYAIRLARKARRVVAQNLAVAVGVIVCGIPLALAGWVSLPAGVILHEGSTLVVVLNGLRLLLRLPKGSSFAGAQPFDGPRGLP